MGGVATGNFGSFSIRAKEKRSHFAKGFPSPPRNLPKALSEVQTPPTVNCAVSHVTYVELAT